MPRTPPAYYPCPECYSVRPSPALQTRGRGSHHERRHRTAENARPMTAPVPKAYRRGDLARHLVDVHGMGIAQARKLVGPGSPATKVTVMTGPAREKVARLTPAQRRRRLRRMWRAVVPAWWRPVREAAALERAALAAGEEVAA